MAGADVTAQVLHLGGPCRNPLDMAEQNWALARAHYDEICDRFDARFPESVAQFHAALDRRHAAYEVFMAELRRR